MTEKEFVEKNIRLSFEFSRYVLAHPEIDEQIPDGAVVVFHLVDNPEFNDWALKIAQAQRETGQAMVVVKTKGLTPLPPSRLIDPEVVPA